MANSTDTGSDAFHAAPVADEANSADGNFDPQWLLGVLRRKAWLISAGLTAGLAYGAYSYQTAPVRYSARTLLLVNNPHVRAVSDLYSNDAMESVAFDSQLELLRSEKIAHTVAQQLNGEIPPTPLTPSIIDKIQPSLLSLVNTIFPVKANAADRDSKNNKPEPDTGKNAAETNDGEEQINSLAGKLSAGLSVRRIRQTLLMEISYTGMDRRTVAVVANAFADAYLTEQQETKTKAARSAGKWLEGQAAELKKKSLDAELAVNKFKFDHHLSANPSDEMREKDVARQLSEVRAELPKMQARYDHIRNIVDTHQADAVFSEVIGNTIIEQLRTKYLDAKKREAEISKKYGKEHAYAVKLRHEIAECENFIFEELSRVADNYRNELDIASARETALRAELDHAAGEAILDNASLSELRELTHRAEIYKELQKNAMQRYEQTVQQESLPAVETRVVSAAATPGGADQNGMFRSLLASLMIGGAGAAGLAAAWEMLDKSFRTGDQIRSVLGLEFFGVAPHIKESADKSRGSLKKILPGLGGDHSKSNSKSSLFKPSLFKSGLSLAALNYGLLNPRSAFAETLRAIRIAATQKPVKTRGRVLGIVSVLSGEGKTTMAKNLGSFLAQKSGKTLLIDGNLRNPDLSCAMAANASRGLIEAVNADAPLEDLMIYESGTQLAILPVQHSEGALDTAEFLASPRMAALLAKARQEFDHILIDLPPLNSLVDGRAVAPLVDDFLLVVEWGKTPRQAVHNAFRIEKQIRAKCLGAVLNKVDANSMRSYERHGSKEYYHGHCQKYFSGVSS